MPIYGSKFQNLGGPKKSATFWHIKNCYLTTQQMANQSHIQKSTPRYAEHPRLHLWTDSWSNQSIPSAEKCNFFRRPWHPFKCVASPKMVPSCSLVICPPKTPKPHWPLVTPSLRKIFWRHPILAKVLKWPWNHQKLTYVKSDHKMSSEMSQAVLSLNLTKKFQWEVSQIADNRFPYAML